MTAALLAAGWAGLVGTGAHLLRPRSRPGPAPPPPGPVTRPATTEVVGAWVLRRLGRPVESLTACRIGTALASALAALPVGPWAALAAAAAGWALPAARASRRRAHRESVVAAALPEAVDLLQLALGAGLSVGQAVGAVAARLDGPLAAELRRVRAETDRGRRLADALDQLPARAGEATRALVAALVAAERYGAPLAGALERLAAEVRADNRRRAEAAARRVPVKLLFPLVLCILPAFGLLTVAPLVASALRALRL